MKVSDTIVSSSSTHRIQVEGTNNNTESEIGQKNVSTTNSFASHVQPDLERVEEEEKTRVCKNNVSLVVESQYLRDMGALTDFLSVSAGAVCGATIRWLISENLKSIVPWDTFIVNVIGTFVLGIMYGASSVLDPKVMLFIGTGFCGSLTTFSTFSYDILLLFRAEDYLQAILFMCFSLVIGLLIVALGFVLGEWATTET
jgi:CrcB protein